MNFKNKGKCIIFSAPSGAGKTTIVHNLLRQNIGLAFSVSACANVVKSNTNFVTENDCETTNDILGPFYRENSPTRTNLNTTSINGAEIIIKGKVYKSDCTTILENVQVEIWHCNKKGEYDNDSNEFRYRGQQQTNAKGEYNFSSILPGKYLNGALYRPSHIHFRVRHKDTKELISQIYFEGDSHIPADPWASKPKAKLRIIPLKMEDTSGNITINFDIYLTDLT